MFGSVRRVLPRVPFASLYFAAVVVLLQPACSQPTEPHDNILVARRAWLASKVTSYTFEFASETSWFPRSDYYRIRVVDREAVEATTSDGEPVPDLTVTVDEIWDRILAAHVNGELNSVLFDRRGVPIEADMGDWALDGGVRYFVRNFVPSR